MAPSSVPPGLLTIAGLSVHYAHAAGAIAAVREVTLHVLPGECVGIVGESGSGKTQTLMAVMGLLPAHAQAAGSVRFDDEEILGAPPAALNKLRGAKLTMVFQDPLTALTPHLRIGVQMAEVLVTHRRMRWRAAERAALEMLERVGVPEPRRRLRQYPHELSGGLRQRVMLGICLLGSPRLLIADEPTTALDARAQVEIIDLLRALRAQSGMAVALISHDLGVVAQLAERVVVLYAGRVVESAARTDILRRPLHPYTAELVRCRPNLHAPRLERMPTLEGRAPGASEVFAGCAFAPRCRRAIERGALEHCRSVRPELRDTALGAERQVACHYP